MQLSLVFQKTIQVIVFIIMFFLIYTPTKKNCAYIYSTSMDWVPFLVRYCTGKGERNSYKEARILLSGA